MKLHQSIVSTISTTLDTIFVNKMSSDKVVPKVIRKKKFGSRDRSFIAATVYDIVRWKRKYEFILNKVDFKDTMYNGLIAISLLNRKIEIDNINILSLNDDEINTIKNNIDIEVSIPSIAESYDEYFYQFALRSIGEEWHAIAKSLNNKASTHIHVNTKKIGVNEFTSVLEKLDVHFKIPNLPEFIEQKNVHSIEILSKHSLHYTKWYKEKYFYFQDLGSQFVGALFYQYLNTKDNLKILDYCAGHGGKTFQIASLLNYTNTIFATDCNSSRLNVLKQNVHHKHIKAIDFNAISAQLYDAILIDAPCTGTGTFRRQPDLKYNISISSIEEKITTQQTILNDASVLLKENGLMLYATCSVLPQENINQIQTFLEKNSNFKLLKHYKILPSSYNTDGFFICLLRKINNKS